MGRFGQGAGYVGGPTMAMIALKCPQIEVIPAASSSHTRHARSRGPVQTSGRMLWTWDTANRATVHDRGTNAFAQEGKTMGVRHQLMTEERGAEHRWSWWT